MARVGDRVARILFCSWMGHAFDWKDKPTMLVKCSRCNLPFSKYTGWER